METQIKKDFSFTRMSRFMTAGIAVDRYELLLRLGVFALVLNLVYMYLFFTPKLFNGQASSFWVTTIGLMSLIKIVWMIDTGSLFSDYHNKKKVSRSFLLPISQAEQWWARVLRSLISFITIYAAVAVTVIGWIWFTGNYDDYIVRFSQFELLGFEPRSLLLSLVSVLLLWCFCVAVAVFFCRRQRLICFLYFILTSVPPLLLMKMIVLDEYAKLMENFSYWSIGLKIAFALASIVSYYRFKRLQVMN